MSEKTYTQYQLIKLAMRVLSKGTGIAMHHLDHCMVIGDICRYVLEPYFSTGPRPADVIPDFNVSPKGTWHEVLEFLDEWLISDVGYLSDEMTPAMLRYRVARLEALTAKEAN